MKLLMRILPAALIASLIVSCAALQPSPASEAMIEPGDKIGDYLIATGEKTGVQYVTLVHCPYDDTTETCEFPVGAKVNISNSIFDDKPTEGEGLEQIWSEHTYQMTIEGRPVNLQAFGAIDNVHPVIGKLRNWNVIVVGDKPGKITVAWSCRVQGETYHGVYVVIFKSP